LLCGLELDRGPKVFDVWRSKGSLYLEDASDEAD
jgi:hypothetical protein